MKTDLENKVTDVIIDFMRPDSGRISDVDHYKICKNIVKAYGNNPSNEQIEREVKEFFNIKE